MNTATELRLTSLAERIAKVRGRMLVATLTKVPPSNKELFVALCLVHEQHEMERSAFSSESSDDLTTSLQKFVSVHGAQENARQQWPECMLIKNIPDGPENDKEWLDWDDFAR